MKFFKNWWVHTTHSVLTMYDQCSCVTSHQLWSLKCLPCTHYTLHHIPDRGKHHDLCLLFIVGHLLSDSGPRNKILDTKLTVRLLQCVLFNSMPNFKCTAYKNKKIRASWNLLIMWTQQAACWLCKSSNYFCWRTVSK